MSTATPTNSNAENSPEPVRARPVRDSLVSFDWAIKLDDQERVRYDSYMKDLDQEASMVESHYGRGKREGLKEAEAEGLKQGLKQGLKEGELKAKWETARNMRAKSMDFSLIAELTGLSVEALNERLSSVA